MTDRPDDGNFSVGGASVALTPEQEAARKAAAEKEGADKQASSAASQASTEPAVTLDDVVLNLEDDDEDTMSLGGDEQDDSAFSVGAATLANPEKPKDTKAPADYLVLHGGHVVRVQNGSITVPSTSGLSHLQKKELARGMVAAAIAEGCYKKNPDGSFTFAIKTNDFVLRAAMEAQIEALGHKFTPNSNDKSYRDMVASERRRVNTNMANLNYYDEFIDEVKKSTVADNLSYCSEVENSGNAEKVKIKLSEDFILSAGFKLPLREMDPKTGSYDVGIIKKAQEISKGEYSLADLRAEIARKHQDIKRQEAIVQKARKEMPHDVHTQIAIHTLSDLQEHIDKLESKVKEIKNQAATSKRVKLKQVKEQNNPNNAKQGFFRKYYGGISGEANADAHQTLKQARVAEINKRYPFRWGQLFTSTEKRDDEFIRNFRRTNGFRYLKEESFGPVPTSDLIPARMREIRDEVASGGILRDSWENRKPILAAADANNFGDVYKQIADQRDKRAKDRAQKAATAGAAAPQGEASREQPSTGPGR